MGKEIDEKVIRMLSQQGCIELFWEELRAARVLDPAVTREAVFEKLNAHFREITGMNRYIDYECFRRILIK